MAKKTTVVDDTKENEEAAAEAATQAVAEEAEKSAAEAETAAAEAEGKKLYQLNRDFWNGRKLCKRGTCYYFVPGMQPKTATPMFDEDEA